MRSLNSYNKIVIKIGSAVLAGSNGLINHSILASISEDIAWPCYVFTDRSKNAMVDQPIRPREHSRTYLNDYLVV